MRSGSTCPTADNGWDKEPRVWLNLRRPFSDDFELRKEDEWPLAGTQWTKLYLAADKEALTWRQHGAGASRSFEAMGEGLIWASPPLEAETEITGPLALKLFVSSSTADADLFVTVQAWSPDGREVEFQGTVDPHTPIAQGWLRASHRKLDPVKTLPYRPYHAHDDKQPLVPGKIYELDIEIWPTCILLPKGFTLSVDIRGKDFERPGPATSEFFPTRGSGPWYHDDPLDRPAEIFAGTTTVHTGPDHPSHLLLPVIPPR